MRSNAGPMNGARGTSAMPVSVAVPSVRRTAVISRFTQPSTGSPLWLFAAHVSHSSGLQTIPSPHSAQN